MRILFGFWSRSNSKDPANVLKKMASGLDNYHIQTETFLHEKPLGLGIAEPLSSATTQKDAKNLLFRGGDIVLSRVGRIDNREELIGSLGLKKDEQEITDEKIILESFRRWQPGCFKRLIGDFSIVIWDRENKRLFCAVDPVSYFPFFYAFLANRDFLFSNDLRPILSAGLFPRKPDELFIIGYLLGYPFKRDHTGFKNIKRLLPGTFLDINGQNYSISQYFSFENAPVIRFKREEEYQEAFRDCFFKAVRARLRTRKKIGMALSGGLDSSSICSVASTITSQDLHTYSAVFPHLKGHDLRSIDEREYIFEVLKRYPLRSHLVECDKSSPLKHLDSMLEGVTDLFWGTNSYLSYELYKAAKEDGVGVFLNGLDGDTVLSHGLEFFPEYFLKGRWNRLFPEFYYYCRNTRLNFFSPKSWWKIVFEPIIMPLLGKIFPGISFQNLEIISRELVRRYDIKDILRKEIKIFKDSRSFHIEAITSPVFPLVFEAESKLAGAFGIEIRSPFFDRRVMEFCIGIPVEQKIKKGFSRSLLRNSLKDLLPQRILSRLSKGNLGVNFYNSFLQRDLVTIDNSFLVSAVAPFIKEEFLKKIILNCNRLKDERKFFSSLSLQEIQDLIKYFQIILLAKWLRRYFN